MAQQDFHFVADAGTAEGIPQQVDFARPMAGVSRARAAFSRYSSRVALVDAIAATAAGSIAVLVRFANEVPAERILLYVPLISLIWMMVLANRGAYSREGLHTLRKQQGLVAGSAFITYPFVAMFSYTFKNELSRGFLIITMLTGMVLMHASRALLWRIFHASDAFTVAAQRTLVVGGSKESLTQLNAQLSPVAMLPTPEPASFDVWLSTLVAIVKRDGIDVVLLSSDHNLAQEQLQKLTWALEGGVDVVKQVGIGALGRRAYLRIESGQAYLHLVEVGLTGPKRFAKRLFDMVFATVFLVLLSPLFLLIALAVKLTSSGPVFFVQPRVGQYGRLFPFPKFRSMHKGADKERTNILGTPDEDMVSRYKNDPRITKVGRVIRRFSIDELPQFWSVLIGDMSVVGPRPVLEEELHLLAADDHRRHAAKPGLTGLWQVSGRKEVSWNDRMDMDIDYLEQWSLIGDIALVARTVVAVFTGRGAV